MSIDRLQEKIRKLKNPAVFYVEALPQWLPPSLQQENKAEALHVYFAELLDKLKDTVPAVRFGFSGFALMGSDGLAALTDLMSRAREMGYYVLMDMPELLTPAAAGNAARLVENYPLDGIVVSSYLGSDVLLPLSELGRKGKTVFVVCRTANRSAVEVQDLLTGGRHVHTAAADIISRCAEPGVGKCGYCQMGILASASTAQSLSTLRNKFPKLFMLLDGSDYPNANAKNCRNAFDRFGHGAAACISESIGAAWQVTEDGSDYLELALQAAIRMKKNITRYITVL